MKSKSIAAGWLIVCSLGGISAAIAMGPDPGGHTGATVTPQTTKTGNTAVDTARAAASGDKTETNGPAVETAPPADKHPPDKPSRN